MFCPKCGVYLVENDLLQRNVKYSMGNVAVEYDARCPNCKEEIGKMSWGKFTIHPELSETRFRMEAPEEDGSLIPPPPELRTVLRKRAPANPRQQPQPEQPSPADTAPEPPTLPEVRVCPHCGRPWPEEGEDAL